MRLVRNGKECDPVEDGHPTFRGAPQAHAAASAERPLVPPPSPDGSEFYQVGEAVLLPLLIIVSAQCSAPTSRPEVVPLIGVTCSTALATSLKLPNHVFGRRQARFCGGLTEARLDRAHHGRSDDPTLKRYHANLRQTRPVAQRGMQVALTRRVSYDLQVIPTWIM